MPITTYTSNGKRKTSYCGPRQYTSYFTNGKIEKIINSYDDELEGDYIEYNWKGEIILKKKYDHNTQIEK
jgi:hypothetical protein